jgi:hypothetical protein
MTQSLLLIYKNKNAECDVGMGGPTSIVYERNYVWIGSQVMVVVIVVVYIQNSHSKAFVMI